MKLARIPTIDLSTGHLTQSTRAWMSRMARRDQLGIMERAEGFFLSTVHVDQDDEDRVDLPPDLEFCLRFAAAHDVQYVLFDQDADPQPGLPLYDEDAKLMPVNGMALHVQELVEGHDIIEVNGARPRLIEWHDTDAGMMRAILSYVPGSYSRMDLKVEKHGEVLEDKDYEIRGGAWFTMGNASIRICAPEQDPGLLRIVVLPRGMESFGTEFGRVEIEQDDLAQEIADHADEIAGANGSPMPS